MEDFHRDNEEEMLYQQDVRITNEMFNRIIACEYIQLFLAVFGIAMSIVINEIVTSTDQISTYDENLMLSYIGLSNVMLAMTAYFRYDLYLTWYKKKGVLAEYDTLISTGWWRHMLLEQVLVLFAPYPFLQEYTYVEYNQNWNVTITYSFNQILTGVSFLRIYIILRFTLMASQFMSPRASRVASMNGCDANHMYALKAIMKELPFTFIACSLGISIFLFGY